MPNRRFRSIRNEIIAEYLKTKFFELPLLSNSNVQQAPHGLPDSL